MAERDPDRAREGGGIPPDPVIEAYKKDVDRTLLRENLKLTPAQRLRRLDEFVRAIRKYRGAARRGA